MCLKLVVVEPIDAEAAIYPIPGDRDDGPGMVLIGDRLAGRVLADNINRRFKIVDDVIDGPVRVFIGLYD